MFVRIFLLVCVVAQIIVIVSLGLDMATLVSSGVEVSDSEDVKNTMDQSRSREPHIETTPRVLMSEEAFWYVRGIASALDEGRVLEPYVGSEPSILDIIHARREDDEAHLMLGERSEEPFSGLSDFHQDL